MAAITERDLEILRLKFKIEVHTTLLRALYIGLAQIVPGGKQACLGMFAGLRKEHGKVVLKNLSP